MFIRFFEENIFIGVMSIYVVFYPKARDSRER